MPLLPPTAVSVPFVAPPAAFGTPFVVPPSVISGAPSDALTVLSAALTVLSDALTVSGVAAVPAE